MAPGNTEQPRLPQILRALVDTLLDGSLNYCFDAAGKVSFFFDEPIQEPRLTPFERWYTAAAVAAPAQDYSLQVGKRLAKAGVPSDWFGRLRAANDDDQMGHGVANVLSEQVAQLLKDEQGGISLLMDVVSVLRILNQQASLAPLATSEIQSAVEKKYLREFTDRYPRIIDRAMSLAPVAVVDALLNEAANATSTASTGRPWSSAPQHWRMGSGSALGDSRITPKCLIEHSAQRASFAMTPRRRRRCVICLTYVTR